MSATRLLVLGVVRMHGKAHGYQVRRELLSWAADKWGNVQPGSIYHALKKMTAEGLLEQVEEAEDAGGPERVAYKLTEDGETEFLVQLGRALSSDDASGYSLSAAVTFMPSLPRAQVLALLKQQLANMEAHAQSTHYAREHSTDLGKPPQGSQRRRRPCRQGGVDLNVSAGELVGFLGPNGAGKTTTLRMLTTLLKPTAGEATVGGCDLLGDPLGVRRRIGYVAQGGGTAPESKVVEEIEFQGRLYRMSKADALKRGATLAEQLDLAGLDQRLTKTLSGGQRRRLDIALGLIHSPGLVFLDEPSTGLDPQSRANLWDHIRRLRDEQGVTVFLTTHYLDEADALSDRLIVIDDGKIVAKGTPDSLKARVSGDSVSIGVAPESASETAEIAGRLEGVHEMAVADGTVRFRVPRGDTATPELLRALDARGITMTSMQVHRPTLDDVFLTLTGRSLRDAEEGAPLADTPEKEATHVA